MKNRTNLILLSVFLLSVLVCIGSQYVDVTLILFLPAIPMFCLQWLLCRVSRRFWVRILPALPSVVLGLMALFYLLRDSGWDRLAALILGAAAIAPTVGCLLGWCAWGIPILRRRRKEKEQG